MVHNKVLKKALWAALGGLFAFGAVPGRAAPTADLTIRVGIRDTFPPEPVADLAALATITPGQVISTWTAPHEDVGYPASGAVTSYIVKYATFSADSLGPDPAAWWALAATAPNPPLVPRSPGEDETMVISDLLDGTTYWFAIRSVDDAGNVSPIDTNTETFGRQAWALTRSGDAKIPAPVAGYVVTPAPGGYTLTWPPVTINADGSSIGDLRGYRIYKSTDLYGSFTNLVGTVPRAGPLAFSFSPDPAGDVFYLIVAEDTVGNESSIVDSNFLHVTPTSILGQTAKAWDSTYSRVYLPEGLIPEMKTAERDLLLRVDPNTDPAMNPDVRRTLGTYTVALAGADGASAPADFAFSRPAMNVILSFQPPGGDPVDPEKVGVLWWNGKAWIKVGAGQVDTLLNTVSFKTALPGIYQVRRFEVSKELSLDKASVFPRIFSPNGDGINDVVYFVVENPNGSPVSGKMIDMSGAEVGSIGPAGPGAPTADSLMWNGRDKSGNIVPAGVYIYQIKGEGKTITGTVVVAL